MILEMVGHRDPNMVPVAAFYGDPDLRVNFCGKLAADANAQVGAGLRLQRRPRPGNATKTGGPAAGRWSTLASTTVTWLSRVGSPDRLGRAD
jgi:hypothetical protein